MRTRTRESAPCPAGDAMSGVLTAQLLVGVLLCGAEPPAACLPCACDVDPWCCAIGWDPLCKDVCEAACGVTLPAAPECLPQCDGKVCGTDGCGGTCGECPPGALCSRFGGGCIACTCNGLECGDDGCGGDCGTCDEGLSCYDGRCMPPGCGPGAGPACQGCGCESCVCEARPSCCSDTWDEICAEMCRVRCGQECPCPNKCLGRECGHADCGLFTKCGECPDDGLCTDEGLCCTPDCEGKECGWDGCKQWCGECPANETCDEGQCICIASCESASCGDDGCGGSCGTCDAGDTCVSGACAPAYPIGCYGAEHVSASSCPANLSATGCCDDQDRVTWCDADGQLRCVPCATYDSTCGWRAAQPDGSPAGFHDCAETGEGPPSMEAAQCGGDCSVDELCPPPDPPGPDSDPELTDTTIAPEADATTGDAPVGVTEAPNSEVGPELASDAPAGDETCAGDGFDEEGPATMDGETTSCELPGDVGPEPASDSLADQVAQETNQDGGVHLIDGDDAKIEVAVGPDIVQPDGAEDDFDGDLHAEVESSDFESPEAPDGCSGCSASGAAPESVAWALTLCLLLLAQHGRSPPAPRAVRSTMSHRSRLRVRTLLRPAANKPEIRVGKTGPRSVTFVVEATGT